MVPVFIAAVFLNAALLFLVQPLVGKLLLPTLGGTPSVWNTCLVFFQLVLLIGYGYAWLQGRMKTPKSRLLVHLVVLGAGAAFLPIRSTAGLHPPVGGTPVWWLLGTLTLMAGVPFFAVSTTGPMLQRWFGGTDHKAAHDPYFLYAASNAGSLLGLLIYPFVIERFMPLSDQRVWWAVGYGVAITLTILCGVIAIKRTPKGMDDRLSASTSAGGAPAAETITWSRRGLWVLLAMVPSSLSMGCTQHLTTDIAAVPLLWVAPLALYLLSFVLAFSKFTGKLWDSVAWGVPIVAAAVFYFKLQGGQAKADLVIQCSLILLLAGAWACHGRLASIRPGVSHLTEYFVWIAVGGALGGMFNALLAPVIFKDLIEYPIAIIATVILTLPSIKANIGWVGDRVVRVLLVAAGIVATVFSLRVSAEQKGFEVRERARTFFGIYRVAVSPNDVVRELLHGTTTHGLQTVQAFTRSQPTTYYHKPSPIGETFEWLYTRNQPLRVAAVGLGTGTLAYYTAPEDPVAPRSWMTFYEIDPVVVQIAENTQYFTYMKDARDAGGKVDVVVGDARQTIRDAADASFDLIILDAFSSDAIPVHLLTKEALDLYLTKLKPDGIIAFHVSNRHLNLKPMLSRLAGSVQMVALGRSHEATDEQKNRYGNYDTEWAVFARTEDVIRGLQEKGTWTRFERPPETAGARYWTDDFSNIIELWK